MKEGPKRLCSLGASRLAMGYYGLSKDLSLIARGSQPFPNP